MIAFIDDHRALYGVEPICKILPIAPSSREVAALPAGILVRPGRGQPGDDGRREVRGIPTQQGGQRVLEVAGRDAA